MDVTMELIDLVGIPTPLRWQLPPAGWSVIRDGLSITAAAGTDWFVDPDGSAPKTNAPSLLYSAPGDVLLSARVTVEFVSTFDAGALVVHIDDRTWAKLCLELSPQGRPMVVSVVTRGTSDDCNSFDVDGHRVWLRVARLGQAFAFHASADGEQWSLVRYFALDAADNIDLGFLAQSPTGAGCTASFDAITHRAGRLADLRSGV